MWLTLKQENGALRVINAQPVKPPDDPDAEIFEWFEPFEVYQPELTLPDGEYRPEVPGLDPRPEGYDTGRDKFDELAGLLTNEIDWLDTTIPLINGMDAAQLQAVIKRLAQENRYILRAWQYVARKLL